MENQNNQNQPQPSSFNWKKYLLKTWHPQPTVKSTILIFGILGFIFLAFGIMFFVINSQVKEVKVQYDNICEGKNNNQFCQFNISVDKMQKPVFLFYELDNFFQNHRRYIKSKNAYQLSGQSDDQVTYSKLQSSCDPAYLNQHFSLQDSSGQSQDLLAWDNKTVLYSKSQTTNSQTYASPCGLIAKSFFTDNFQISKINNDGTKTRIQIDDSQISWPGDIGYKFKRQQDSQKKQWIDPEDPHFVVWMRTAGLPNFRKTWGKIDQDLEGQYEVLVTIHQSQYGKPYNNRLYDSKSFNGQKHIILSTSGAFGGRNDFLAIGYIIVSIICFLITGLFVYKRKYFEGSNKDN